eukprot:TRINITY_DN1104_c1_g1_i1.p1 TRINITY_DN1104_c1_g1~~TRINITY_DN1104_c1_g1_i1.p1  ORF type:complete len:454 (-),score=85.36 TRINITY_DN1104_c1_g1_i1:339-1700(-)
MARWKVDYNDLELCERIGKGNFGEVWQGKFLGLDVAIKKLFFVDDDFMQKYIEREMDTLRGLNHPNIVQLMGLCTETGDIYIITEFVHGGSLRQVLKNGNVQLSWARRVSFARDIALAMTYLHHKDIMHRDLKSANLLVGSDWRLKVCDFGLARNSPTEGEKFITTVGTNEWMAPEVALQDPYDKSADVFSYGMVLYEIITRKKPPPRKLRDGYAFDTTLKDTIPPETPSDLWDLLLTCAHSDPAKRPTFADILKILKDLNLEDTDSDDDTTSSSIKTPKSTGLKAKSKQMSDSEDEESEEETTSYIARGREITEVTKAFKSAFGRKAQFCHLECSIPKKPSWSPQDDVVIKLKIENQSPKIVKLIKYHLQTTKTVGKKKKIIRSNIATYKGCAKYPGFPVKNGVVWEGQIGYELPELPDKEPSDVHELRMEFTLAGGLVATHAIALLPMTID